MLLFFLFSLFMGTGVNCFATDLRHHIEILSSFDSRYTGTAGAEQSADYIEQQFEDLGFETNRYPFLVTVRKFGETTLQFDGTEYPLTPFKYNVITPQATDGLLEGPLYYVGKGSLKELDHKQINGAILLLDFHSGINWANLASFGAKAIIYLHQATSDPNYFFQEKQELTPIQLPCFWMSKNQAEAIFELSSLDTRKEIRGQVAIKADVNWQQVSADNIYTLIPGTDETLKQQLVIFESFYDNKAYIPGNAPGADEAISIATLLDIAKQLKLNPPARTVILAATAGHDQTLAGMRDLIWSINANSKEMRTGQRDLMRTVKAIKAEKATLSELNFPLSEDRQRDNTIKDAISNSLSLEIDILSRRLMDLRLQESSAPIRAQIQDLAKERFTLKRLGWLRPITTFLSQKPAC